MKNTMGVSLTVLVMLLSLSWIARSQEPSSFAYGSCDIESFAKQCRSRTP